MWWAGRPGMDLYLGVRTVAACQDGELLLHERVRAGTDTLDVAGRWIAGQTRRGGCAVWLSGALARPVLLPAEGGLQSPLERQRVAQALARRDFACEDADVRIDDRGPGELAVVLPRGLADEIGQCLRRGPLVLRGIRPLWAAVLAQQLAALPTCGLLGIADGESVTTLGGPGDGFTLAESVVPSPQGEALAGAVQRSALRAGAVPGTRRLVALDFDSPSGGAPSGPFARWLMESSP